MVEHYFISLCRKVDRERTEDLDCTSKECNYFGRSPEEHKEKQAREETHSLDEIQFWDEDAFPALSVCVMLLNNALFSC